MRTKKSIGKQLLAMIVAVAVVVTFTATIDSSYAAGKAKSKNAYAKALKVEIGNKAGKLSPKFKRTQYSYSINLTDKQKSAKITLTKAQKKAKIYLKTSAKGKYKYVKGDKVAWTVKVEPGKSKIIWFQIKAQNGKAKKTYKVTVKRAKDKKKKTIGFYADAADSYYQLVNNALVALAKQDPETDWTVHYKVGRSTASEQLSAVEDFISAGYDAIVVIQNNPSTTSQCIKKCKAAKIPYFGAVHSFAQIANAKDSAGSTNYDHRTSGLAAGKDALAAGVKKVVMIEGVLGQNSAADLTLGFLQAYEDAGKSLGFKADGSKWTAKEIATEKPSISSVKGSPDITVVCWASGSWMAEPARWALEHIILALGEDGWDGAYVQNNPMAEGAMAAMNDAGLTTEDYWLGSCDGRELSWGWAKNGGISMDVNQSPALEGAILYQQLKAYFAGKTYRKHLHPYAIPYNKSNIKAIESQLVPVTDVANFMKKIKNNSIVWKIDNPKFLDAAGNW